MRLRQITESGLFGVFDQYLDATDPRRAERISQARQRVASGDDIDDVLQDFPERQRDEIRDLIGGTGDVPALDAVDPNAPSGQVRPNPNMNPLFTMQGASRMTRPNAEQVMRSDTLPRARRMAGIFGSALTINDAIAKAGTSRETQTTGSQHFSGRGLDISTAGMSNQQKLRLVQAGRAAGFRGFGFGANILHVDTGPQRAWAYGNSTYGGVSVAELDSAITNGTPLPGETGTATA